MQRKHKPVKPLFPKVDKVWSKRLAAGKRRGIVLKNHKGNNLKAAQAMDYLAKGTWEKKTKELASADAAYFFHQYKMYGK